MTYKNIWPHFHYWSYNWIIDSTRWLSL